MGRWFLEIGVCGEVKLFERSRRIVVWVCTQVCGEGACVGCIVVCKLIWRMGEICVPECVSVQVAVDDGMRHLVL